MLVFLAILAAQDTTCTQSGNTLRCQQHQPLDYGSQLNAGRNMVQPYRPPQRDEAERLHRLVGSMVAKGDCAGAEKLALEHGDIDLAAKARDYCRR